jgi:hypothetical protein
MDWQQPVRINLDAKPEGRRNRGRLKMRREDGVDKDVKALGERGWRNIARNIQI